MRLLWPEKSRPWVQVRVTKWLVGLLPVQASCRCGDVVDQIHGPSKKLLHNDATEGSERGIFSHLVERLKLLGTHSKNLSILLSLGRNIVMIFSKVVGIDVMSAMRRLPREVWGHQRGVDDPTKGVVEQFRWRE